MTNMNDEKEKAWHFYRNGNCPLGHKEALSCGYDAGVLAERERLSKIIEAANLYHYIDASFISELFPQEQEK